MSKFYQKDIFVCILNSRFSFQTLYVAMKDGGLKLSYLRKWLNETCTELVKLEKEATPEGWLLLWDRYVLIHFWMYNFPIPTFPCPLFVKYFKTQDIRRCCCIYVRWVCVQFYIYLFLIVYSTNKLKIFHYHILNLSNYLITLVFNLHICHWESVQKSIINILNTKYW